MEKMVSKSQFKPHALQYFREVEQSGEALIITDFSKPVLKIIPYEDDPYSAIRELRGSILRYDDPCEPVGLEDWELLK